MCRLRYTPNKAQTPFPVVFQMFPGGVVMATLARDSAGLIATALCNELRLLLAADAASAGTQLRNWCSSRERATLLIVDVEVRNRLFSCVAVALRVFTRGFVCVLLSQ